MCIWWSRSMSGVRNRGNPTPPDPYPSQSPTSWFGKLLGRRSKNCELIVGIDFTRSNLSNGTKTFGGKSLHDVNGESNPYIEALSLMARKLNVYDDDQFIPCYGFGDSRTGGKNLVFSFFEGNRPAKGLSELLRRYKKLTPSVDMHGPTCFAPLIHQAMRDVYNSGMKFHVLLILADGQVSPECLDSTRKAIVAACEFPLSIVMIGVGDGPWTDMEHFDDDLPGRPWDNFHFFDFNEMPDGSAPSPLQGDKDNYFVSGVLKELPEQMKHARKLTGMSRKSRVSPLLQDIPDDLVIDPPPSHFH